MFKKLSSSVSLDNFTFLLQMQNIPAASDGKHLGFAWGPGDILVYETLYKASGMLRCGYKSISRFSVSLLPFVS